MPCAPAARQAAAPCGPMPPQDHTGERELRQETLEQYKSRLAAHPPSSLIALSHQPVHSRPQRLTGFFGRDDLGKDTLGKMPRGLDADCKGLPSLLGCGAGEQNQIDTCRAAFQGDRRRFHTRCPNPDSQAPPGALRQPGKEVLETRWRVRTVEVQQRESPRAGGGEQQWLRIRPRRGHHRNLKLGHCILSSVDPPRPTAGISLRHELGVLAVINYHPPYTIGTMPLARPNST